MAVFVSGTPLVFNGFRGWNMCLMLGNKYLIDGRYDRALCEYEACLEKRPEAHEVALLGLICAVMMGNHAKTEFFFRVVESAPVGAIEVNVPLSIGEKEIRKVERFLEEKNQGYVVERDGKVFKLIKEK